MSVLPGSTAQRAEILGSLKNHYFAALAALGTAVGVPESSRKAIQGALAADKARIDRLSSPDGELWQKVLKGELPHEKWVAIAKLTWDDITAQMKYLGQASPSWKRVWDEILVPTATSVAELPGKALDRSNPTLALVALALVALVVLKLS